MDLTLKCGDCRSTMTLDFEALRSRAAQQSNFAIRCQACNTKLNDEIVYRLLELIRGYQLYELKWEFEFKLTPPKESQT